jgi:hypothetical protein
LINECLKKLIYYVEKDSDIIESTLKFEKISAVENDFNCLISEFQINKQTIQAPASK